MQTLPDPTPLETPEPARARPRLIEAQALHRLPVEVSVIVGRARPTIREVLAFGPDTVLELDCHVDDALEICIGDRVIARGVLEEVAGSGQLGVRLTEVSGSGEDI